MTKPGSICPVDGVPFKHHKNCWRCGSTGGRGHVAGPIVFGLCAFCREELCDADSDDDWRERPIRRDGARPAARYLTTREAAKRYGVSPDTIRDMTKDGRLRRHELPRRGNTDPR